MFELEKSVWAQDPISASAESRLTSWILDKSIHSWKNAGTQMPSFREAVLIASIFCQKHREANTRSEIQRISELVSSKGMKPMNRGDQRKASFGDDLEPFRNQSEDGPKLLR